MLRSLTPEEMHRYEIFRRSALNANEVKQVCIVPCHSGFISLDFLSRRCYIHIAQTISESCYISQCLAHPNIPIFPNTQVMSSVLGPSAKISRAMLISMRGITKIFVGQLVETGTEYRAGFCLPDVDSS
jgi:hypothetical protein